MKPLYSPGIDGNCLPPWIGAALKTRQAQALILGRDWRDCRDSGKHAIAGFESFNFATAQIWKAAAAGDPYADLALLRLEAALADARAEQRRMSGDLGHLAGTVAEAAPEPGAGIVAPAYPERVPPLPANPYGHLGSCRLADFDGLVVAILSAWQRGGIDRKQAYLMIRNAGRVVRRIFCLPHTVWRHTGVTRQDIQRKTPLARQAEGVYTKLGVTAIPADVLQGFRHGRYAPAKAANQPRAARKRKRDAHHSRPRDIDGNRKIPMESIR